MGKISYVEVELKLSEFERRISELEKRPRAGRPGDRVKQAEAFLRTVLKKGPVKVSWLMREAIVRQGFNEALVRKAARRMEVVKNNRKWALMSDDSLGEE